jgi:hypothetical protein
VVWNGKAESWELRVEGGQSYGGPSGHTFAADHTQGVARRFAVPWAEGLRAFGAGRHAECNGRAKPRLIKPGGMRKMSAIPFIPRFLHGGRFSFDFVARASCAHDAAGETPALPGHGLGRTGVLGKFLRDGGFGWLESRFLLRYVHLEKPWKSLNASIFSPAGAEAPGMLDCYD